MPSRRSPWRVFLLTAALATVIGGVWAVSTPLMAAPDEPSHAIRAWAVAHGQLGGDPVPGAGSVWSVTVPRWVADLGAYPCFAFDADVSAGCVGPIVADGAGAALVEGRTASMLNSPVYFGLVGLPTLAVDGAASVYLMRFVSAAIGGLLLGVVGFAVSLVRAPTVPLIALAVATTPMVAFLSGTLNPSGMEVTGAAATFAGVFVLATVPLPPPRAAQLAGLIAISATLLAHTRSIALVWGLVIVVACLLLMRRRVLARNITSHWMVPASAGFTVLAVGAAAAYFAFATRGVAQVPDYPQLGLSPVRVLVLMLRDTFEFGRAWIGFFGWLDTPLPSLPLLTGGAAALIVVGAALVRATRREVLALGVIALALLAVPAVSQASLIREWGFVWQGRYTLALFVVLIVAAGCIAASHRWSGSAVLVRSAWLVLGLVAITHVVALLTSFARYIDDDDWIGDMLLRPQWQPPVLWIVLLVVPCVCVAVAGVTATAAWRQERGPWAQVVSRRRAQRDDVQE